MSDRLATDILVHEWNGANGCIHGCLCVHTIQTWNQLCPNRVHELQQRLVKAEADNSLLRLTLKRLGAEVVPTVFSTIRTC